MKHTRQINLRFLFFFRELLGVLCGLLLASLLLLDMGLLDEARIPLDIIVSISISTSLSTDISTTTCVKAATAALAATSLEPEPLTLIDFLRSVLFFRGDCCDGDLGDCCGGVLGDSSKANVVAGVDGAVSTAALVA